MRPALPCPSTPTALARIAASSRLLLPSRCPLNSSGRQITLHSRHSSSSSSATACFFAFALSSPPSCAPPSCCPSRGRNQPLIWGLQPLPEGTQPKSAAATSPWLAATDAALLLLVAHPIIALFSPATALPLSKCMHHLDCVDDANAGHTLQCQTMGRPGGTPCVKAT